MVNNKNIDLISEAILSNQIVGEWLPSVYIIEPTNRCDVNCVMCPNSKFLSHELGDMDVEQLEYTVKAIAPFAELVMLYFLGESTLHPNITDILRIARKHIRGKIVISTNAFQISDEAMRACVSYCDIIITCVDRWEQGAYERVRVGSKFETVVNNINELLKCRGLSPAPTIIVKSLDIFLSGESAEARLKESGNFVDYWTSRGAIAVSGWLNTWAGQMAGLSRLSCEPTPYSSLSRTACADLWFKMVINWRGEVVLCCHDWRSSTLLGSSRSQDLREIWHGAALTRLRASHAELNFGCNALCGKCKEWGTPDELMAYIRLSNEDLYTIF